jgi:uncharacterized protein
MVVVDQVIQEKLALLKSILQDMESVVVAYSGGVDSTFLAATAHDVLGERCLAVTASSASMAPTELEEAVALAEELGLRHRVIQTQELSDPEYIANGPRRCYFCKVELYAQLRPIATQEGLAWVASGTNLDDLGDYRPGLKAGQEYGVRNPMVEAKLTKEDIRSLSRERGLSTWDKPAQPCLSSRIPFGTPVSVEVLGRIAQAEAQIKALGLRQFRVRHHDTIARIEVEQDDMALLTKPDIREKLVADMRALGYLYVTLDLAGFQTGSLNAALKPWPRNNHT